MENALSNGSDTRPEHTIPSDLGCRSPADTVLHLNIYL